ncbi:MAG: hypothetical protein PHH77_12085, partial [Victivallaceae bacterium]|nr:hypothetical protein [Victivallaceae bacterium]
MKKIMIVSIILPFALLTLTVCLPMGVFAQADEAAKPEYHYRNVKISEHSFKKLFAYFKGKFFTLPDGKVVPPLGADGELKKISFSKNEIDSGEITG